ncbi:unnamed protein product [Parascedosporium putredinis]|uniref:Uncharacterized protein n=1 Tax=Parascedosporium putredinis TaxID=1442378 RepID=A0A9P1HAV9_9PEZI|nr:unnamed protein product [Parascedosporium putredinis]CAI8003086.1 unnamed protein product [Parascedosporium putredinis]
MPVTIKPSAHDASTYGAASHLHKPVSSAERLLKYTLADSNNDSSPPRKIVKSTYTALSSDSPPAYSSKNGFVHACIEAYNQHLHLQVRPEDVWVAILTQLSIYVNANAEELRHIFVSHDEKKDLELLDDGLGLDYTKWDHGELAYRMTKLMAGAIHDPEWRSWILPEFSTTTKVDQAVASVIFMGTLQKYFTYAWGTRCGLPSVTLLGTAQDWRRIRDKCKARLPLLGPQCEQWLSVLEPVLDGFVQSFKAPESEETISFGNASLKYNALPVGFTKVPVTLIVGLSAVRVEMVAGSLCFRASDSRATTRKGGKHKDLDTLQPETGWIMYET